MKNKYREKLTESESKVLEENRELYKLKMEIHELLKKLVIKTDLGSIEEGYADEINFDIGEHSIYSCAYYQQLRVSDSENIEHELDDNLEKTKEIYVEIKKRADKFDKLIETKNLKTATKVFEKPLCIDFGDDDI